MDKEILKKSLITGTIFVATYLALIIFVSFNFKVRIDEVIKESFYFPLIVLFLSILFYFLFRYQKDEYHNKKILLKFPLAGFTIGIIFSVLFAIILMVFIPCSGEDCLAGPVTILFAPFYAIVLAAIFFIFSLNAYYKTNLYIVALTIFAFALILPLFLTVIGSDIISDTSSGPQFPILMAFGFLFGTLIAFIVKVIALIIEKLKSKSNMENLSKQ